MMDRSDERLCNLNARIPRALWRRVKLQATGRGLTLKDFVRAAIEERMSREQKRRAA
jgi:predicted DNA binding CopG/RHH family protein